MKHFTREHIEMLKALYPAGTRIDLVRMGDDPHPLAPGSKGTVALVDSMGTVHVNWDNGRTLGLIPGEDVFRKI